MNRVIKFRAWDKEENKMINNVVPFFNSDGTLECLVFGYSFGGYDFIEVELDKYQHIFTDPEFDERFVLMQCTGLKDRNGVEIYEGDVVSMIVFEDNAEYLGDVVFENGCFCLNISLDGTKYKVPAFEWKETETIITVIGNIHENPELLEVES